MEGHEASLAGKRMPLGIVVERRASSHPLAPATWRILSPLLGGGPGDGWRLLASGPGWQRFYAGVLDLTLYSDEVASYRYNLESQQPAIYVILRRSDGPGEVAPFHATVCPVEAQDYMGSGDEIVEAVPMPDAVLQWLRAFVDRHPPPEAFIKRGRSPRSGSDRDGHRRVGREDRR